MKVINEPKLKTKSLVLVERTVMLLGWSAMSYFMARGLTLLVWIMGGSFYHKYMLNTDEIRFTLRSLAVLLLLGILTFSVMWAWSHYNYKRYAHLTRRKFASDVTIDELATLVGIPTELAQFVRDARWSDIYKEKHTSTISVGNRG